ncbi:MAG: hypothetical protein HN741_12745 [Anaerolineae bacterium]|jgi:hypothetical protein|nr:hypothetical protein [Anaerolineae bacterium]
MNNFDYVLAHCLSEFEVEQAKECPDVCENVLLVQRQWDTTNLDIFISLETE